MKNFLAVFTGNPQASRESGWDALDVQTRQAREKQGIAAWHAWMQQHQKQIVVPGGPIGKTRRASRAGIADARNDICGYVVVSAESHEAAAQMFVNHPHFAIFPGEGVDVMECLPTPSL